MSKAIQVAKVEEVEFVMDGLIKMIRNRDTLIAELLEALIEAEETIEADIEECRDFREGFGKDGCKECKRYKECDRWIRIRKVRSAIAKAKGETE